jgi:hypothetical protein
MTSISNSPLNFYLAGLSTNVTPTTAATFFPPVNPINFTDYSANAICRMKLSVAQNMFQFWTRSADLSSNSLADIVFRTMYDPSSGFNINDASANPLSNDFTRGSIVTWSDPSNANINLFTLNGSQYQTLFPQSYLRFLSWLIFGNANLTSNFLNPTPVMSSVDSNSKLALNNTLKGLTAYVYTVNGVTTSNNVGRQYNYEDFVVDPNTFLINTANKLPNSNGNPSSQIFQQIRTNAVNRIQNINPATSKIVDASNATYPNGAWYKMPFIAGDSIYFILTINVPTNQVGSDGTTNLINTPRKFRIRMYIMADNDLNLQTVDSNNNPINFGAFNIYPAANSLITSGYSYADTVANNQLDPNDIKTPGP